MPTVARITARSGAFALDNQQQHRTRPLPYIIFYLPTPLRAPPLRLRGYSLSPWAPFHILSCILAVCSPSLGCGLPLSCVHPHLQTSCFFGVSLSFVLLVHESLQPHLDPVVPFLRSFGARFSPDLVADAEHFEVLL